MAVTCHGTTSATVLLTWGRKGLDKAWATCSQVGDVGGVERVVRGRYAEDLVSLGSVTAKPPTGWG
jgi:hypothetical protein